METCIEMPPSLANLLSSVHGFARKFAGLAFAPRPGCDCIRLGCARLGLAHCGAAQVCARASQYESRRVARAEDPQAHCFIFGKDGASIRGIAARYNPKTIGLHFGGKTKQPNPYVRSPTLQRCTRRLERAACVISSSTMGQGGTIEDRGRVSRRRRQL